MTVLLAAHTAADAVAGVLIITGMSGVLTYFAAISRRGRP